MKMFFFVFNSEIMQRGTGEVGRVCERKNVSVNVEPISINMSDMDIGYVHLQKFSEISQLRI